MRLRVDERQRILRVTHPRAIRSATALAWAVSHKLWVEEQLDRTGPAEPFVPGALIPLEGEDIEIDWSRNRPRTPVLDGGQLLCGGPEAGLARRIELFLRRQALDLLSLETAAMAERADVKPSSVAVGDARTRWGSCSSNGAVRYSWRLILAPPEARRFVVAHEVAHLRHLDHGTAFKGLERELFGGDTATARALLRRWSPRLRRIGLAR